MSKRTLLLIIVFVLSSLMTSAQTSWEIDKWEEDIIVYTRMEKDSDFKSFKAVMTVDVPTDEIIEVLKNANDYVEWYGYTKTSEVLKQEEDIQYNYVETLFPWPYSNRDMVYKMSIDASGSKEVTILLEGIPDYIPEKKGIVRMKKAAGFILLKSMGKHTEITYQFHSEPGDNIPVWLANSSIAELPFKTFLGLRKTLKE
ncbi:hypothetical protein JKA74_02300 [Marivirga sp. S37H4]|uniref:START domain-containing protein n=1 Tax=Marivirga aurantiaca TaxID=2802615 RepID=A0A934WVS1_9BACT|nr:START domain-containing protein [Marivirga aurantiaca]MBK6263854.1 hypothetical protein [Marivirga aurantiaca]